MAFTDPCRGWVANAPDVRLQFQGGWFDEINFWVESNADTTLIINDPNGNWWCDDDSGDGLDPLLSFVPMSGQYDIWVGSYSGSYSDAELNISELPYQGAQYNPPPPPSNPPPPPPPPPPAPSGPDHTLNPPFGTHYLASGFTPDPYEVEVVAGGNNDASALTNGTCQGFIADAPDARLVFSEGVFSELYFSVNSASDTTLVIRDPTGQFWCDDDGGNQGFNPLLRLAPRTGEYNIWVGTYGRSRADATLSISELYSY